MPRSCSGLNVISVLLPAIGAGRTQTPECDKRGHSEALAEIAIRWCGARQLLDVGARQPLDAVAEWGSPTFFDCGEPRSRRKIASRTMEATARNSDCQFCRV